MFTGMLLSVFLIALDQVCSLFLRFPLFYCFRVLTRLASSQTILAPALPVIASKFEALDQSTSSFRSRNRQSPSSVLSSYSHTRPLRSLLLLPQSPGSLRPTSLRNALSSFSTYVDLRLQFRGFSHLFFSVRRDKSSPSSTASGPSLWPFSSSRSALSSAPSLIASTSSSCAFSLLFPS